MQEHPERRENIKGVVNQMLNKGGTGRDNNKTTLDKHNKITQVNTIQIHKSAHRVTMQCSHR